MKQHITVEQLNELSEKGKEKLRKWWKPIVGDWFDDDGYMRIIPDDETKGAFVLNSFHTPLLSIGQMIEFLDFGNDFSIEYEESNDSWRIYWGLPKKQYKSGNPYGDSELCDSLWEACREILDK